MTTAHGGRPRFWTPDKLWRVCELIERGLSDDEIGRHFGVSGNAVRAGLRNHGLRSRRGQFLSACRVAQFLGHSHTQRVRRWLGRGWLRGVRGPRYGCHRLWLVRSDDLWAFLDDPAHWHLWEPATLRDPHLRRHYTALRAGEPLLSESEVAERLCVTPLTVRRWCERGLLHSVKRGRRLLVPAAALDGFTPPSQRDRRGTQAWRWTPERDARLHALRAAGRTWRQIGQELGASWAACAARWQYARKLEASR